MLRRRPEIAVVEIGGTIGMNVRAGEYGRLFRRLREDDHTKAVLLEIDSPGGSAVASDYLYTMLRRLGDRKPLFAYIRGMGASGGYFLACAAERVVAMPSAVVGSIGVISIRPVLVELLDRVGVGVTVSKTGPYKDMGAPYRVATAEEMEKEQQLVDRFFDRFVDVVATERGLPPDRVREYATGEVFVGDAARERGLVDETGDFDRALEMTAEAAGVAPRFSYVQPRRPLLQRIMAPMGIAIASHLTSEVESRFQRRLLYQAQSSPDNGSIAGRRR